jgi:hypothetical protein
MATVVVLNGSELGGKERVDQSRLAEPRLANNHESEVSTTFGDCWAAPVQPSSSYAGTEHRQTNFVPL